MCRDISNTKHMQKKQTFRYLRNSNNNNNNKPSKTQHSNNGISRKKEGEKNTQKKMKAYNVKMCESIVLAWLVHLYACHCFSAFASGYHLHHRMSASSTRCTHPIHLTTTTTTTPITTISTSTSNNCILSSHV